MRRIQVCGDYLPNAGHDDRRIGCQVDAAAAQRAIGLVIVRECIGAWILCADQGQVVIEQPHLGVLVQVAVVNVRAVICTHVEDLPSGFRNTTDDPSLLSRDAPRRSTFQEHRDCHPLPDSLGKDVAQRRILEGVAGKTDAARGRAQVRCERIESVIGRHEHLQIGLFVA